MIAKAVKGRGFRGALDYDLRKDHARVIDSNMTGNSPRELAAEFREIRKLRPGLNKAVLHVSLSAAPGEHLTDRQWIDIARRYLLGMGLEQNQYVLTRHLDTDHEHVHLLANRIRFDGTVTSDSHDYRRQEALMRAIEHDLGLQQVALSRDCERRAASKGEIEEGLRTGCASTRQQLQQLCDAAMVDCPGFSDYAARLMAAGVELVPVTQLQGTKLSGLSYRLDGVTMKGSDLGKRYSPAGLAKHGVGYDKERDFETVSRCLECGAPGQPGATASDAARGTDRERGAVGVVAGTAGTGDGRADGGIARDAGGHREEVPGAGRELEASGRCGDGDLDPDIDARGAGSERHGLSGSQNGVASLPVNRVGGRDEWSARERILALASPTLHGRLVRDEGRAIATQPRDRTQTTVRQQIGAAGAGRFDVLIRDVIAGTPGQHQWSMDEVLENIAWLKRMNGTHHNISVRPGDERSLELLGGLVEENLLKISRSGLMHAKSVEAGGGFAQSIPLRNAALLAALRTMAELELNSLLCDAQTGVSSDEFNLLAGFVNHTTFTEGTLRRGYVLANAGSDEVHFSGAIACPSSERILDVQTSNFGRRSTQPTLTSQGKPRARGR